MKQIKFKLAERLPALRQAYIEGRLGFQNEVESCQYRYGFESKANKKKGPIGCAIGVMLTNKEVKDHSQGAKFGRLTSFNGTAVSALLRHEEIVVADDPDEIGAESLRMLQEYHDNIVRISCEYNKEIFVNYLNGLFAKYGLEPVT